MSTNARPAPVLSAADSAAWTRWSPPALRLLLRGLRRATGPASGASEPDCTSRDCISVPVSESTSVRRATNPDPAWRRDQVSTAARHRDPSFARALLGEAVQAMVSGAVEADKSLARDDINATLGFAALGERVGIPPKSLMRMFSESGNPAGAAPVRGTRGTARGSGHPISSGATRPGASSGSPYRILMRRLALPAVVMRGRNLLAGDGVTLAEPRAEVDQLAALAAERPPRRLRRPLDRPLAGRAGNGRRAHVQVVSENTTSSVVCTGRASAPCQTRKRTLQR